MFFDKFWMIFEAVPFSLVHSHFFQGDEEKLNNYQSQNVE